MNRTLAVAIVVALLVIAGGTAQQSPMPSDGKMAGMSGMGMHEQMMADMKAMDSKLDEKVAAMNAAQGDARIDAIVAVVNEMAAQHKKMMAGMHGQMMGQMPQSGPAMR